MTTTQSFADLGVGKPMIDVLSARGIDTPFPIQVATLPDTLAGRDALGRGKTGSGKTLAFCIPLVDRLARTRNALKPRGLVLAPTRELASQIAAVLEPLAAAHNLKVTTIYGGVPQSRQASVLRSGIDIVVACPGRLEDLMKQRVVSLDGIEVTVLDEADHMADLGFLPAVTRILAATPDRGHRMLFSATLDNDVDKLVKRFLRNPVTHSVDAVDSPVSAMTHHVFHVAGADAKKELVHRLASGTGRRLLFMRTKHQARRLAKQLTESGVPSVDLHGNLSQPARERNLAAFSTGRARVLVATDIAARGVHRSGRTARAGSAGNVVTVALPEQRNELQAMMRKANIDVRPQQVAAHSAQVQELVGDLAPYQAPAPKAEPPRNSPERNGGRRHKPRSAAARKHNHVGGGRVPVAVTAGASGQNGAPQRRRTGAGKSSR
jgi:superfamily II DNA/RNA helicase